MFNETLVDTSNLSGVFGNVCFTSNDKTYDRGIFYQIAEDQGPERPDPEEVEILTARFTIIALIYQSTTNDVTVYTGSDGWNNVNYRTITITDTSSLTNREEFTTWLKSNAVKQGTGIGDGYTVTLHVDNPSDFGVNGAYCYCGYKVNQDSGHGLSSTLTSIVLNNVTTIQFYFNEHQGFLSRDGAFFAVGNTLGGSEVASLFADTESDEITVTANTDYYLSIQVDPSVEDEVIVEE